MSRSCTYCDGHHPTETCTERLEAYHGVPADHSVGLDDDATVWVQDLDDETWHASMVRDDDIHQCACGARLQCPVGGVKPDSRMATVGIEKCEACQDYLAEDEETVPDGGEFSRASELRADGGVCTDDTDRSGLPQRDAGVPCENCGCEMRRPDTNRCAACGQFAPDPRYAYSLLTDTWYRVTEYDDLGDGKIRAKSKEEVSRDDVPQNWLDATKERGEA